MTSDASLGNFVLDPTKGLELTFGRGVLSGIPYRPSLGVARGVYKLRKHPATCIIVHETGPGPEKLLSQRPELETLEMAAVKLYQTRTGNNGPHYVCGKSEVIQTCPEQYVAFHSGSVNPATRLSKKLFYRTDAWKVKSTEWWRDKWIARTPLELDGGKVWLTGPNNTSIGIECVGEKYQTNLYRLLANIRCEYYRNGVALVVFGHHDIDPYFRSNRHGPYDPNPSRFNALEYCLTYLANGMVVRPGTDTPLFGECHEFRRLEL